MNNRIYFADKRYTRKRRCPNLWPVECKDFHITPREHWGERGLVAYIKPVLRGREHMIATISIFDSENVRYRASCLQGHPDVLISGHILGATYARGDVLVSTANPFLYADDTAWNRRKEAIDLVKLAVEEFILWFPETNTNN